MVEVSDIYKKYKKKQILCGTSFSVSSGEMIAIVGRNGCGKSTLLQILAGVTKADSGNICYFGNSVQKSGVCQKFCGYVPQQNPLFLELSVQDNLKFWGTRTSIDKQKQVIEQLQMQDILKTPVAKLSGGMQRRVALACVLQEWPPILLLDEPTSALDIYYKESIQQILQNYLQMNGIVIMATHEIKEIEAANRCYVMKDGRLEALSEEQKLHVFDFL